MSFCRNCEANRIDTKLDMRQEQQNQNRKTSGSFSSLQRLPLDNLSAANQVATWDVNSEKKYSKILWDSCQQNRSLAIISIPTDNRFPTENLSKLDPNDRAKFAKKNLSSKLYISKFKAVALSWVLSIGAWALSGRRMCCIILMRWNSWNACRNYIIRNRSKFSVWQNSFSEGKAKSPNGRMQAWAQSKADVEEQKCICKGLGLDTSTINSDNWPSCIFLQSFNFAPSENPLATYICSRLV